MGVDRYRWVKVAPNTWYRDQSRSKLFARVHSPLHVNVNPRSAFPFPFPFPHLAISLFLSVQIELSLSSPIDPNQQRSTLFFPPFPGPPPNYQPTSSFIPSINPPQTSYIKSLGMYAPSPVPLALVLVPSRCRCPLHYRTPLNSLARCLSLAICGDRGTALLPLRTYSILHHLIHSLPRMFTVLCSRNM